MTALLTVMIGLVSTSSVVMPSCLSDRERDVILELNLARTRPAEYAGFLRVFRTSHVGDRMFNINGRLLKTREGLAAVDEAIAYLEKVKPVGELKLSEGLSKAAADHAGDIGSKGLMGHDGSDGSKIAQRIERYGQWKKAVGENIAFCRDDARTIVMELIIDDGIPKRGHRKNIFNSAYKVAGVAIHPHVTYGHCCVIDFAAEFSERP